MMRPIHQIGIVGGGQLGRMIAFAARRMGISVIVLDPDKNCPAAGIAEIFVADYSDEKAMMEFSKRCEVVTIEFENLSVPALKQSIRPVYPSPEVLSICQDRIKEKLFLSTNGFPVTRFLTIPRFSPTDPSSIVCLSVEKRFERPHSKTLSEWITQILSIVQEWIDTELQGNEKIVMKSARMGYDGKSQTIFHSFFQFQNHLTKDWKGSGEDWILEQFVPFQRELSIIVGRNRVGETVVYPLVENEHRNHILFSTRAPAPSVAPQIQKIADWIAHSLPEKIGLVGLLCVELFEKDDTTLLINELAPRPHNSGHWSIEGSHCSQFEQIVRILIESPLGLPQLISESACMINLLGDLWSNGTPNWSKVLSVPGVFLHLYEKAEARPGRKMGHLTAVGHNAYERAKQAYTNLL